MQEANSQVSYWTKYSVPEMLGEVCASADDTLCGQASGQGLHHHHHYQTFS